MDINNLTAAQLESLEQQIAEKKQADRLARANREQEYKDLASATVDSLKGRLLRASAYLATIKRTVIDEFNAVISLKDELYGIKDGQRSHTFTNQEGDFRIIVGYYLRDAWDDTVGNGEELVKKAIKTLGVDEKSEALVDAVMKLLEKNKAGALKGKSVLDLQNLAPKINNDDFTRGVEIIRAAYKPTASRTFVRAEALQPSGAWQNIPLGMTEA